ncbi:MAG: hypothetical protein NDJ90_05100 [Oligoflexia bacterium]|nr:hypothetical protein [Oligoflexia bacterium]
MLNVVKEQIGSILSIRLSGAIEESTNLEKLLGPPAPEMHIHCKEVSRINSVGVKLWIKYFQDAQSRGSKLKFSECSTAIVEQINLISNFIANGVVESIFVPFSCGKCRSELVGLFKTEDLKKVKFKLPTLKCSKCTGPATFDDIPEEYFAFLMR